jgi:hypothetical protein
MWMNLETSLGISVSWRKEIRKLLHKSWDRERLGGKTKQQEQHARGR